MPEIAFGKYGPWYALITLVDGQYNVIFHADPVTTFLVKDRPQYRIRDRAEDLTTWKFTRLKDAIRFSKRELRRWKRLERKEVKRYLHKAEFTEMRIY